MNVSSISLSSYSLLSDRTQKTAGGQMDPTEFLSKLIAEEDTDGDGAISATETRLDSERFNEIDSDSDGLLSSEELMSMLEQMPPKGGPPPAMQFDAAEMAAKIVSDDDADGDGAISATESRLDSDRFNEVDADGDGLLSTEEITADLETQKEEGPRMSPDGAGSQLDLNQILPSLLQALEQNDASSAYSDQQSWMSSLFSSMSSLDVAS